MTRWYSLSLAAATSVALAACADSGKITEPAAHPIPTDGAAQQFAWDNDHHIMPTRAAAMQNAKPGGGGSGTGIYYHGGPVLQTATSVVAVYWAASPIYSGGPSAGSTGTGSGDGSLVGYFLSNLGGSPYFNINTTYTDGSGNHIANIVTYAHYWANNTNVPANGQNVTDAEMVAMLQSGFDSGTLTYDASTLYAIFTAGTVNLGGGFGTQYCAYHTHGTVTINGLSKTVLYAAMPYNYAYPSGCTSQLTAPNGDPAADAEVNTLAHETEETTTDLMGTAWYDRRGYENADKCAWKWGTTSTNSSGGVWNVTVGSKNFLVQMNWVNQGSGGCLNSL